MLPSHNGAYTRLGAETDRIGDLVRIGLGGWLRSFRWKSYSRAVSDLPKVL
jgi:hypothetical protein